MILPWGRNNTVGKMPDISVHPTIKRAFKIFTNNKNPACFIFEVVFRLFCIPVEGKG